MERPHILFVCARNQWRSPTAEAIYRSDRRIVVRSAGLSSQSPHVVGVKDLDWADLILVMERRHKTRLLESFRGHPALARVQCLDIPDDFEFMDQELIELLTAGTEHYLGELLRDSTEERKS